MAVGVDVFARDPGIGLHDVDADLLMQLAREGLVGRFAGLDLAAGKFPVAGVHLAGWALREEESAVGPLDDRGRYFNHFFAWRPAQSRANW
jgi:hypothetical protein